MVLRSENVTANPTPNAAGNYTFHWSNSRVLIGLENVTYNATFADKENEWITYNWDFASENAAQHPAATFTGDLVFGIGFGLNANIADRGTLGYFIKDVALVLKDDAGTIPAQAITAANVSSVMVSNQIANNTPLRRFAPFFGN